MKSTIMLSLFLCLSLVCRAKNVNDVDSIRIIGYNTPVEFCYDLGKERFYEAMLQEKADSLVSDVMLPKEKSDSLMYFVQKLKKIRKLRYAANESFCKALYHTESGHLFWIETTDDYRILFVLFKDSGKELIWGNQFNLQRGRYEYEISPELRAFLDNLGFGFSE